MAKNKENFNIFDARRKKYRANKQIKSIQIARRGSNTVDANLTLGFEEDERTYEVALEILNVLNIQTVNLLTNNPNKIVELEKFGLKINKRIPLSIKSNKHNENYLKTKKYKGGHLFI